MIKNTKVAILFFIVLILYANINIYYNGIILSRLIKLTANESNDYENNIHLTEEFYLNLLNRLIDGDIKIHNLHNHTFFEWEQVKLEMSDESILMTWADLEDMQFYIFDINDNGELSIGLGVDGRISRSFSYDKTRDVLIYHPYTEYLSDGFVYHEYINNLREIKTIVNKNYKIFELEFLYNRYTINDIEITEEQWELFRIKIDEMRLNAPRIYYYEDLVKIK